MATHMRPTRRSFVGAAAAVVSGLSLRSSARAANAAYHVAVYGGTPAGIMAALAVAREGLRVVLILGSSPLGGMVASGLGRTDLKTWRIVGGLPLQFFQRLGAHYGLPLADKHEPHVAQGVFARWLEEAAVAVHASSLEETRPVVKSGASIEAVRLVDGAQILAQVFIDASYEGDLMAGAGVRHVVGRESSRRYGESLAGFGVAPRPVSKPAVDEAGHLLPGVRPYPPLARGAADAAVQTYNFRLCLTDDAANRVPFGKPPGYDPTRFALFLNRIVDEVARSDRQLTFLDPVTALPNRKFDGDFDIAIGLSAGYARANPADRSRLLDEHRRLTQGFLYFCGHDASVPSVYRELVQTYGLAADEFVQSGHWPPQLYIREARRLLGEKVLTQRDVQRPDRAEEIVQATTIGKGGYHIDCHDTALYKDPTRNLILGEGGFVGSGRQRLNEANIYQIPYEVMLPRAAQADNLLVPVCISASHVAYCSVRVEPQYMILGEAAGVAAAIAARERSTPGALAVQEIQATLLAYGAIIR